MSRTFMRVMRVLYEFLAVAAFVFGVAVIFVRADFMNAALLFLICTVCLTNIKILQLEDRLSPPEKETKNGGGAIE